MKGLDRIRDKKVGRNIINYFLLCYLRRFFWGYNFTIFIIVLKDENDNIITLMDNCHWTATIQLDFIYKNRFYYIQD